MCVNTQFSVSCLVMGAIYITGPVLIKSDDNPTFLAVYRVEERVPWESADDRCKDLLKEGASLLDASDQEMFDVSVLYMCVYWTIRNIRTNLYLENIMAAINKMREIPVKIVEKVEPNVTTWWVRACGFPRVGRMRYRWVYGWRRTK